MLFPLLFALSGPAPVGPAVAEPVAVQTQETIRLRLSRQDRLHRGDRVRVYVRAPEDGYLVVLHAEPAGRVRVLFPLDPLDDNFVRAGREYEVRGRGDREALTVYENSGAGLVYAAFSRDPFRFDGVVLNAHWDYRAAEFAAGEDPEADLTALASRMAAGARFDYDLGYYTVGTYVARGGDWYEPSFYGSSYGGHHWHGGGGFSIHVGIGSRYWYDPWYAWYWDPYWDPWWWYPPTYWGPWAFAPFGYRYVYGYPAYYYPYYPTRYVYLGSGVPGGSRGYVFKSQGDRYGLNPDPVGPRRRAPASTVATTINSPSRTPAPTTAAPGGRRTVTGGGGQAAPASPATVPGGRRTVTSGGPTGQAGPATPTTRQPAEPDGRRLAPTRRDDDTPPIGTLLPDGSWRLPTPPRRSGGDAPRQVEPEVLPERPDPRTGIERRPDPTDRRVLDATGGRGLRVTDDAPPTRRAVGRSAGRDAGRPGADLPTARPAPERTPTSQRSLERDGRRSAPERTASPQRGFERDDRRPAPTAPTRAAPTDRRVPSMSAPSRGTPSRSAPTVRQGAPSRSLPAARAAPPSRSGPTARRTPRSRGPSRAAPPSRTRPTRRK